MAGRVPFPQRLPGTYFNIRSEVRPMSPASVRGTVIDMMPLTWFNEDELVDIHIREWQSSFAITKLGISAAMAEPYDEDAREAQRSLLALLESGVIAGEPYGPLVGLIFPQNTGGAKAQVVQGDITWKAKKNGTAGNKITINVVLQNDALTITTFFNAQRMYVQGVNADVIRDDDDVITEITVDAMQLSQVLRDNMLVDAVLDANADKVVIALGEVALEGGDNGVIQPYNSRQQSFWDAASKGTWHTIALSIPPDAVGYAASRTAFRSWLRQLNNDLQEERHGIVVADFADENAGMDSDQIDVWTQDYEWNNDYMLGLANVARLHAGRSAGTAANRSQTNDIIPNVTAVSPLYTIRQLEDADARGLCVLKKFWDGRYVIQRDINSFVSWVPEKNMQWRDNRTKRGLHDTKVRFNRIFDTQHKGHTDNNTRGREKVLGDCNNLFNVLETENIMTEHDISKLAIYPSVTSPTAALLEARRIMYVTAIDTLDFDMTITW